MQSAHVRGAMVCIAGGLLASVQTHAGSWCDVVFKDVAREAPIVVLARVEKAAGASALHVTDVFKDESERGVSRLSARVLDGRQVKHGDHVLLALDAQQRPVALTRSLGACEPTSVLAIRGGKLRSRERMSYDSQAGTLTLEELCAELHEEFAGAAGQARAAAR